jgi:hypothetical protein
MIVLRGRSLEVLKLVDLIELAGVSLTDFKIHCATGKKDSPLEAFFDGTFKTWQEHQTKRNFECEQILSLIHLGGSQWLFAGVWSVLGVKAADWRNGKCYKYETAEVADLDHLTGMAIVQFEKRFRASYLKGKAHASKLRVSELRARRMTIGDFPGYKSVRLSFRMLQTVVREEDPSWRSALSNVSGVYLIADVSDGRLYVGSAGGSKGVWSRWNSYAETGHGGNTELRALLKAKGVKHAGNFHFSLLEVLDPDLGEKEILGRESFWKDVLMTREFGLNKN